MSTLSSWFVATILIGCSAPLPPEPPRALPAARTGRLERRMANCPNALANATTRVEDVPGGVAVTITVADEDAQRALRSLADLHQRIGSAQGRRIEHTGMHGGPGDLGHCPIFHNGTHVSYVRVRGGVRIEVRVLPGHDVDALRREVYARAVNLPRWIANQ